MTPEAECLLATLRHTSEGFSPELEPHVLLELAESHGVFMLFCRDFPGQLPQEFARRARALWTTSAFLASVLDDLLRQFSLNGIEILPLKGPLLATVLYGSPSLRISDDLDLLVQPADFPRATALLNQLGFQPLYAADDYHQTFQRRETLVELHFAFAPPSSPSIDLKLAWARARLVEFRGQRARFLALPDLLLYLVIHAVKHEYARLVWVLDSSRAIEQLTDEETKEVLHLARGLGVEGALLTTCALAQLCFHIVLPPQIAEAIIRKPIIAVQAAAISKKMLEGPADPQTTHQGAGFFLQLEPSARARWAQRLRLFQPSQQDYAWARNYKIHPRWMQLLRPFRLLSKHGPGTVWKVISSQPSYSVSPTDLESNQAESKSVHSKSFRTD